MNHNRQTGSSLVEFLLGLLLMLVLWAAADVVIDALRQHNDNHIRSIARPGIALHLTSGDSR